MFTKRIGNKKKLLQEIEERFGQPVSKDRVFYYINAYSNFNANAKESIDRKTWDDLAMDEVFSFIDRTESKTGEQVLSDILHRRRPKKEFEKFNSKVDYYAINSKARVQNTFLLKKYNGTSSYNLANLLLYKQTEKVPGWTYGFAVLAFLFAILSIFYNFFFLPFIGMVFINTLIHYYLKKKIYNHLLDFRNIKSLITFYPQILKNDNEEDFLSAEEKKIAKNISKKCFLLSLNIDVVDEFSSVLVYVSEIIKGAFLLDAVQFNKLMQLINQNSNTLLKLYKYIGSVDSAIAIASLKKGTEGCEPTFISNKRINANDVYHPLLEGCKRNSIALSSKSAIITGGNMSGKTTFLKVIGINAQLAQTINYTFSSKFEMPYLKIYSSIQNEDNLGEGISFFMDELLRTKQIIDSVDDVNEMALVLFDEVYRGTNSKDRITLASSVLNYLNRENCFVLATTHDLDILHLIKNSYEMFYFDNLFIDNKIIFDYKIQKGIQNKSNVVELIQSLHFPDEILSNTLNYRTKFKQNSAIKNKN